MTLRLPFRVGATSYVIPDDILPNVRRLAGLVDDVEVLLFESRGPDGGAPSAAVTSELEALAADHGLTYTVHLPLDIHTGHPEAGRRAGAVEACRRIIGRMERLAPQAYILHLAGDGGSVSPSADIPRWQALQRQSLESILADVEPERLCVENLDYPFAHAEPLVGELGLGVCIDVGHLLVNGHDAEAHLERHLDGARVVHLHGVCGRRDHRSIRHLDPRFRETLLERACSSPLARRVVTLELFGEQELIESLDLIRRWAEGRAATAAPSGARPGATLPTP